MGAAPSLEILRQAPFRSLQNGPRQIGLIPITPDFFPSADCALFRQFYEARNDPSVRYYQRNNVNDDFNLETIPAIDDTLEELYQRFMLAAQKLTFPTNAALKEALESDQDYKVRPISYAIVFLYDGIQYVADGSVRLETAFRTQSNGNGGYAHPPVYVKVIGGIMDIAPFQLWDIRKPSTWSRELTPEVPMNMRMFITKSAGDHNMVRVTLLTTYTFRRQFVETLGQRSTPRLRTVFQTPKTYIPFLCFMRELRDRTMGLFDGPDGPLMWIDEKCLHGDIPANRSIDAVDAYAQYYVEQVEHQAQMRAAKLAAKAGLVPAPTSPCTPSPNFIGLPCQLSSSHTEVSRHSTSGSSPNMTTSMSETTNNNASVSGGAFGETGTREKINYVLRGYIVVPECDIPAYSLQPHEVYVACRDAVVRVVAGMKVPAWRGPHPLPHVLTEMELAEAKTNEKGWYTVLDSRADSEQDEDEGALVLSTFKVHRGDIITFSPTQPPPGAGESADGTSVEEDASVPAVGVNGVSDSHLGADPTSASHETKPTATINGTTNPATKKAPAAADDAASALVGTATEQVGAAEGNKCTDPLRWSTPRYGLWRRNPEVFIESVLLSLVKDECKNAREADIDDPRWLHDPVQHCPKHDGVFYIWKFRRGKEIFYYGTVPKFANPNRAGASGGGGGASGQAHERKGVPGGNRSQPSQQQQQQQHTRNNNNNARQSNGSGQQHPMPSAVPVAPTLPHTLLMTGDAMTHMGVPIFVNANGQPLSTAAAAGAVPQSYNLVAAGGGGGGRSNGLPTFTTSSYLNTGNTNKDTSILPGYAFAQASPPPPTQSTEGPRVVYMTTLPAGLAAPNYQRTEYSGQFQQPSLQQGGAPMYYDPTFMTAPNHNHMSAFTQNQATPSKANPSAAQSTTPKGISESVTQPIVYGPPHTSSRPGSVGSPRRSGEQTPTQTSLHPLFGANNGFSPSQPQPQPQPLHQGQAPASMQSAAPTHYHSVSPAPQAQSAAPYSQAAQPQVAYILGPNNQIYMTQVPAPANSPKPVQPHYTQPQQLPFPQMTAYQTTPFTQDGTHQPLAHQQHVVYASPSLQTAVPQPQQPPQQPVYVMINGQLYQMPAASGGGYEQTSLTTVNSPQQQQQYTVSPSAMAYWT